MIPLVNAISINDPAKMQDRMVANTKQTGNSLQSSEIIEVPISSYNDNDRQQAFTRALNPILIKTSNNQEIVKLPAIKAALSKPGLYVKQFNYVNKEIATGKSSLFLQINFDFKAIDKLLQRISKTTSVDSKPLASTTRVVLRITNVYGLQQYNEVAKYLNNLNKLITRVDLVNISATEVELAISILGGSPALSDILSKQSKLLRNIDVTVSPPGIDLDYKWVTTDGEQSQAISTQPVS